MEKSKFIDVEVRGSSHIVKFNYWTDYKLLGVIFRGGAIYHYFDVPIEIVVGLIQAESVGIYFDQKVKRGFFNYEKVN